MALIALVSKYPREECVRRLREKVRPWWGGASDAPQGRVGENWATLRMPIWYRNSFQTVLRLTMTSNPAGGTDLTCRFDINRFVLGFILLWFTLAVGIDLVDIVLTLAEGRLPDATNVVFTLGFLAFGSGLVAFGRYLARNEQTELLLFLEDTLDVRLPPGA